MTGVVPEQMMDFTGERYVPSEAGAIKYEHLHRYAVAQTFCVDKTVLDIASGEGYGTALLADCAEKVIGVDIDEAAIAHAKAYYQARQNLEYKVGSCAQIPLPDHSVDVVTSFETIEHHDQHEEMMREICRVLKPEGMLVISSPNKLVYSDACNYQNPYHVKELYYQEFKDLLNNSFGNVRIVGQRLASASFITPLEEIRSDQTVLECYGGGSKQVGRQIDKLEHPMYFLAICSEQHVQAVSPSLYMDAEDDLYSHMMSEFQKTQSELQKMQSALQKTRASLSQVQGDLHEARTELATKQHAIDDMKNSRFWQARKLYNRLKSIAFSQDK